MSNSNATATLPDNAYKPLPPGASYDPLVPASAALPELTARSVGWGLFLCVIFTVASAYSGLKVGQVMEAAIPISILAIGLARAYPRRSSLLENVIITGIGGLAGSVVAGAIFTLPALYILKLDPTRARGEFGQRGGGGYQRIVGRAGGQRLVGVLRDGCGRGGVGHGGARHACGGARGAHRIVPDLTAAAG